MPLDKLPLAPIETGYADTIQPMTYLSSREMNLMFSAVITVT